ncbi:MAG: ABC transporter ATP-binding protein [Candidatus Riflebacteria bacterium]|nr:ABC transporter ATP-binding protein [Candidatus Riflebacteria bacterium]
MYAISTKKLTKRIGLLKPQTLIDEVTLNIEEGHVFAMVGPNGAGKTTFFKLLTGLSQPTIGTAEIFGISVSNPLSRKGMAFLPEVVSHPEYLTIGEYLTFHANLLAMKNVVQKQIDCLKIVDMSGSESLFLAHLSKGMRQRVDIARVLLGDPRLVLLDEPSTGLDPIGQKNLMDLLLLLKKDRGITILLNSHSVSIISEICDEVGIMSEGKILKFCSLAELQGMEKFRIVVRLSNSDLSWKEKIDGKAKIQSLSSELTEIIFDYEEEFQKAIRLLCNSGITIVEAGRNKSILDSIFREIIAKSA